MAEARGAARGAAAGVRARRRRPCRRCFGCSRPRWAWLTRCCGVWAYPPSSRSIPTPTWWRPWSGSTCASPRCRGCPLASPPPPCAATRWRRPIRWRARRWRRRWPWRRAFSAASAFFARRKTPPPPPRALRRSWTAPRRPAPPRRSADACWWPGSCRRPSRSPPRGWRVRQCSGCLPPAARTRSPASRSAWPASRSSPSPRAV